MSDLPSATQQGLSAALPVFQHFVADSAKVPDDHVVDPLTGLTMGHLRTIAAALEAPHVPGMVRVDKGAWETAVLGDDGGALLSYWVGTGITEYAHFAAVQS